MDLNKTIEVNNLIDIYGKFLTSKQLGIMIDYFKNDYSLTEIADNLKITKQAVKYSIGLSLDRLNEMEENLHLIKLKEELNKFLPNLDKDNQIVLSKIINKIGE